MKPSSCSVRFLFLRKKVKNSFVYAFLPARCKSWACETCRYHKAKQVRDFILRSFAGREMWMLSITFFHSGTALDAWHSIGKNCNRMLTYARKYSGSFNYVRVVEPHKDGLWPHVHILVDKPIATTEFVKLVTNWGFGWNFHSMPVSTLHSANYVSKYLTKLWPTGDAELFRVMSKTRIVSASRSLGAIFKTESTWECINYDLPKSHCEFMHAVILRECKRLGCTYISSKGNHHGFEITTDVLLSADFEKNVLDPYIFKGSDSFDFTFCPFGFQTELDLSPL